MIDLRALIDQSYETAKSKGWWDEPRSNAWLILLMQSEIAEAVEDFRAGKAINEVWYERKEEDGSLTELREGPAKTWVLESRDKPCGIPSEIADVIIRIADFCGYKGMDLIPVAGLPNVTLDEALAKASSELSKAYDDLAKNPPAPDWSVSLHLSQAVQWLLNFCWANGIDIAKVLTEKAEYNKSRPMRHGGKAI
jgi:NTP pyrophosphatase (non-canonical NTP hydrolase)